MMKMKAKRDRRPLLTQEAPMLSDQMPLSSDDGDHFGDRVGNQTNQQVKKPSWKRLFGKGGGAKRKQDDNLPIETDVGGEGHNLEPQSIELSYSSSIVQSDEKLNHQEQQRASTNSTTYRNTSKATTQSYGLPDKRDDPFESKQVSSCRNEQIEAVDKKKSASHPQSTKSENSSKSRSKSRLFIHSLKKKSAQVMSSPVSVANSSVVSQQTQGEDHIHNFVASKSSRINDESEPREKHSPEEGKTTYSSSTPMSSKATENVLNGTKYDVKKILSKPFGREHVLTTEQTWVVHVSRAEWDADDSLWKYRINIKRREGSKLQDFATSLLLRSLEDFAWLEQSLLAEFFGGLLLPNLSIYLGLPNIFNCQHEVDSILLSNWLSDTLNGIRGQGEIMFSLNKVDISTSESVEAFLYRSELTQTVVAVPGLPGDENEVPPQQTVTNSILGEDNNKWNFFPELCYVNCVALPKPVDEAKNSSQSHRPFVFGNGSGANAIANSFLEPAGFDDVNTSLTIHTNLLKAERDLIWSWRTRALHALEKLQILKEQEKHIGAAWKRFAISVSNLFSYEKDIETARLGDSKSRRDLQIPYRKLQKSSVDDCLRILTRHKLERSTPGIEAIYIMLSTYVADLSMIQPSITAYLNGLKQLNLQKSKTETIEQQRVTETDSADLSGTLADKIQASLKNVKNQLTSTIQNDSKENDFTNDKDRAYLQRQQVLILENRLLFHETLLKDYMTAICKTAPVRTSRMIHAYLEKELEQCKALHDSAVEMKGKINIASKEILSKMIHRHHKETKEDKETEIRLVHKIVNIGNTRKFIKEPGHDHSEEVEKGVELSYDMTEQETQKMKRRDKAMNECRSRIGRWDAKLAMAIMEAVGVSDANVRVEETTRDLRMVRKYAISLRENVERCSEGLEALRMTILQGGMGDIRDIRTDFMAEMKNLLSFAYVPVDDQSEYLPTHLMEKEGIDLCDPLGWKSNERGSCGNALNSYIMTRDSGTEWLLESLGELLKEYSNRVEAIESFVYMECVGIQLEKHFSQARSSALTAFEKKTDITSAINIATRKKMPVLVKELQGKLENLGPIVSHTTVKEAKEAHLESKIMKQELHTLAMRRLARARETSTERAIALMTVWAKEEGGSTYIEQGIIEEVMHLLNESVKEEDLIFFVDASPARI